MNRETIKKYQEEFDHWLNGGTLESRYISNEDRCWKVDNAPTFSKSMQYRIKMFTPKKGEHILVSNFKCDPYIERIFLNIEDDKYNCIGGDDDDIIKIPFYKASWKYAKPIK